MDAATLDLLCDALAVVCFVGAAWAALFFRDRWHRKAVDEAVLGDPGVLLQRSRAFNVDDQIVWLTSPRSGAPAADVAGQDGGRGDGRG